MNCINIYKTATQGNITTFTKMMTNRRLWREAAALILVGKSKTFFQASEPIQANYKIFMTKTMDPNTKVLSNKFTFLKNGTDIADFNPRWAKVFQEAVSRNPSLVHFNYDVYKPNPPVLRTSTYAWNTHQLFSPGNFMHPRLGLRITAIRHTFVETGILLCLPIGAHDLVDAESWRSRVCEDPSNFYYMCENLRYCPDIWSLHEWSNWLTPSNKTWMQQRFDTLFFITIVDHIPDIQGNEDETEKCRWMSPSEALKSHRESRIWLDAPYFYELSRIEKIQCADELEEFSKQRSNEEIIRWQSVYVVTSDGVLNLLPGDDLYPESPDFTGDATTQVLDKTIHEISIETKRFNRIELNGLQNDRSVCNL